MSTAHPLPPEFRWPGRDVTDLRYMPCFNANVPNGTDSVTRGEVVLMRIERVEPATRAMDTALPRIVGVQRACELMLSGREVSAQEALQLGIATELVEPDALQARAQAIARSFVGASPVALSLIKRSLALAATDLPSLLEQEANAQALAMGTTEHREAVRCFLEKRPMPFQWPQA